MQEKRRATRSQVWTNTSAIVGYRDVFDVKNRKMEIAKARVRDLGSKGAYLMTPAAIPMDQVVAIRIFFYPDASTKMHIDATGKVIRQEQDGVGLEFLEINLDKLQDCISAMLSR